ncbi:tyrosinase cofactor [Streptomyces guryensis]|uniref:Tyrosinase cofactor n=1 Tax=Streptomyces guryensis TaxID=2886947 RepID=A0A9Q3VI37_9ACTN|nr:tyrosinase cofactor [Streptomyces guryensis]MCD9872257.1 tyrosinase cofactor [Streptomyces guryensis]
MVVTADGVPMGGEQRARRAIRRRVLASLAALALAPVLAASRVPRRALGSGGAAESAFDEVYRGRRIRGSLLTAAGPRAGGHAWQVTVDGHPLHLMRRSDGTWLSMVNHYSSYRTSLEATRAAVDELGPGQGLRDLAPGPLDGGPVHMGDDHGVRA